VHEGRVSGGQRYGQPGPYQRPLTRRQLDVLGGGKIRARIPGMG
jgi:hypothetical protein